MNKHFFKATLLSLTLIFATVGHVDAARLGGGKSVGRAPSAPIQKQAAPVQKPAQQAQPAAPAPAPQAPAPSRFGGMGGILGGLAAGLGIGYLLSHFGLGEAASSLITGLLIAVLAGFAIMFVMRKLMPKMSSAGQSPNLSSNGMQRTGLDQTPRQEPAFTPAANAFGGVSAEPEPFQSTLPPGFDQQTFLENAKQYFATLQKAWDQGDLASLREFTTPEMFATIQQDLAGRTDASNQTDVVTINAQLLGIETADGHYFCSVQFSGMIREQQGAPASDFSEIWNLSKPVEGPGGWVLAGITQLV
ncbi:Tim44 domain-containing protein [Polynucleobacter sp. 86C-FISCH]|jgi:predicted lipid-binding transport protein (Tim44 family)|uniref:Membrane protein n=1 Tax=Polynucleobacter yangtzensis TaxID=1743159 RepID=A0ABM8CPJ4_9BURK|nr:MULTISPECIES: Tim44-like domain-containing protein [Polynucleobacter]MBU3595494.1 Tim44 domain-containing protein [Polynucleobacter sp. 86C-FISCH]MCX7237551.1 Tim44-like domain-containing protein [Polynucleobacter sp.]BDT79826.1 membrane protein [Polynucleobacter yangtzensis]